MRVELCIVEDAVDSLLPVVQHALNHTPSPKCNGRAPITAHTQQPPGNALSAYRTTEGIPEISPSLLAQWRESHRKELAAARDALHRDVAAVATAKRAKKRGRRNAQPKARLSIWMLVTMSWSAACHDAAQSCRSTGLAPAGSFKPLPIGSLLLKICGTANSPLTT